MGIKSIKIVNLLSFDELVINNFSDINCIIGKNNAGKSNLLKLIKYFYLKLDNEKVLTPSLHSSYSSYGSITIVYDTTRIKKIVTQNKSNNSKFFKHIYNLLFKKQMKDLTNVSVDKNNKKVTFWDIFRRSVEVDSSYELTLIVKSDDSVEWSVKNKDVRNVLNFLYPFFEVETRHIDLYDWERLWYIISKLKTFNLDNLQNDDIINFFDSSISENSKSYSDYINKIDDIVEISKYSYREKVLNYIKVGLRGHTFMISNEELSFQSDGTNSYKYIELLLTLLITLTRREYITPTIYIDEPETGLHPKRNEELIAKIYEVYHSFKKTKNEREPGKYKTPYPIIMLSTHSPNILKYVIKLFKSNQRVFHFSKRTDHATRVQQMNSQYTDNRFLNIFSDNEARLFFSDFILFVEGATEIEVFGNMRLIDSFPVLKKVDVYQNTDVTMRCTNPSYANLSIPYLVLYDADKLICFDINKKEISYKPSPINIDKHYRKVKKSYYGSKEFNQKRSIKKLIINGKKIFDYDSNKTRFVGDNLSDHVSLINKHILLPNNYMLNTTTIEGCLINENNFTLFNQWLISEVINNLSVNRTANTKKLIDNQIRKLNGGTNISAVFNSLFLLDGEDVDLSDTHIRFVKLVKIKHMKQIRNVLNAKFSSIEDTLIVYRLIFNGKTDTLVSMENNAYNKHIPASFTSIVKIIKSDYFLRLNPVMGKTGGWVTRFLDFSIDHIFSHHTKEDAKDEFKHLFPEIYDIIDFASSSIE